MKIINPYNADNSRYKLRFIGGIANNRRVDLPDTQMYVGCPYTVSIKYGFSGHKIGIEVVPPRRAMIDGVGYRRPVNYTVRELTIALQDGGSGRLFYLSPTHSNASQDILSRFAP